MRTISSQLVESQLAAVRIVGLCTSLANAKDLGEWIGASSHGLYNFPPGTPLLYTSRLAAAAQPPFAQLCHFRDMHSRFCSHPSLQSLAVSNALSLHTNFLTFLVNMDCPFACNAACASLMYSS